MLGLILTVTPSLLQSILIKPYDDILVFIQRSTRGFIFWVKKTKDTPWTNHMTKPV